VAANYPALPNTSVLAEKEICVSDIFREVEEDVRKERLEKWWKAYGDYVIALLAVVILGIAGWQLWLRYEGTQRDKAATEFVAAERITNSTQAAAAFDKLSTTAPGGYGLLARLAEAGALAVSGKSADAVTRYKAIAAEDSGAIGATARIRAAWLVADTAPRADLEALLQPVNTDTSAWRQMAREVLAYSDYKAGKMKQAQTEFAALSTDPDSPDALKSRVNAFAAFLASGGAADYGTVPPPAAAPAPGAPPGAVVPPGATP
jgi:hypothetical protein